MEFNKSQEDFIAEYTRTLLVQWAHETLTSESPDLKGVSQIYIDKAQEKGWLSKKEPLRVSASGFSTAASYLRR
jgi:hypothetical protein